MRYATSLSTLALAAVAAAQNVTVIHVGQVNGQPGLGFSPQTVTATNGDIVSFVFDGLPGNHTVSQSAFAEPCQPLEHGFDTGYISVPAGSLAPFPTFNLTITNATAPIWFYCAQLKSPSGTPHCNAGMVGAINPPQTGNKTYSDFVALAASASVAPPVPALSGVNAFATAAPGPFSGNVTGVAVPSSTAPAGSSGTAGSSATSGGSAPTSSKNSAGTVQISGLAALFAAAFGVVLA